MCRRTPGRRWRVGSHRIAVLILTAESRARHSEAKRYLRPEVPVWRVEVRRHPSGFREMAGHSANPIDVDGESGF